MLAQSTIGDLLDHGRTALRDFDTASLDAELLLANACRSDRTMLFRHRDKKIGAGAWRRYMTLLYKRRAGQPVAYLLGQREFWSIAVAVDPGVLIPRPATETLVEVTLQRLPDRGVVSVLELGTGSGAVAMALATERLQARITAVDCSSAALRVARRNIAAGALHNVVLKHSDWFTGLPPERFDFIVSNPPYVAREDPAMTRGDIRFEPRLALDGGVDGLAAIRHIIKSAGAYLADNGGIAIEHGADQSREVRTLFRENGFQRCQSYLDLQGIERVTCAHL